MSCLMTKKPAYEGKPKRPGPAIAMLDRINGCECRAMRKEAVGVWHVQIRVKGEGWLTLETVTLPAMRHPASCQCKTCGKLSSGVNDNRVCTSCIIDAQAEAAAELEAAGIPLGWGHSHGDRAAKYRPEAIREEAIQRGWKPKRTRTTKA